MKYVLLDWINWVQVQWASLRGKPRHFRIHSKPIKLGARGPGGTR